MSLLIAVALFATAANALDYSYTAPSQCDPFTVKWSNGEPPFTVQLTVGFASPTIIQLPDSAWNGKSGSHTMKLGVAAGKNFIITMYDKAGFAKGVNSGVLAVGSSVTNTSCDTSPVKADFTYGAPDALTQCNPYHFLDFPGATLPVHVNGIIANGAIFTRTAGESDQEFSMDVDIRAGTRLVLWMQDSRGRSGGASEVLTVLSSPEDSCISANSPSTTQGSTPTQISSGSGTSTGAIAAAIIGTLIAFAAIGAFFYLRRRRSMYNKKHEGVMADPYIARHSRQSSRFSRRTPSVDLLAANRGAYGAAGMVSPSTPARSMHSHGYPGTSGGETGRAHEGAFDTDPSLTPDPFLGEPTPRTPSSFQTQQQQGDSSPGIPGRRSSTSKAAYGAGGRQNFAHPRFILHTDAGALEEDEVVELPPMYTDTRSNGSASGSASGSGKPKLPPMPPLPDDEANRPISYNSAITLPRGPRTERTLSFGAASSVATGYDDPVLERSVSQRDRSSYAESLSHHAMSSDGSQRPLRPRNPDDEEEEDNNAPGGSSHPQYDFLDDPEFDRSDREGDSSSDVQLAYAAPAHDGPQHPLAQAATLRRPGGPARTNTAPVVSRAASASLRPSASRANSARTPR